MLFCAGDYTKEAIVELLSSNLKTTLNMDLDSET